MAVRASVVLLGLVSGCVAAPGPEGGGSRTIIVPGSGVRFDVVRVPGGGGLRPFWLGKHEVTWAEFAAFENANPLRKGRVDGMTRPSERYLIGPPEDFPDAAQPSRPAFRVRWHGAVSYCDWLSRETGLRFRLPTEAEWEHAARLGFPGGNPAAPEEFAWGGGSRGPQPVGSKRADARGVHDLLGNVWEHCLEPLDGVSYGSVLRGGSWRSPAGELRLESRTGILEDWSEMDPERPMSLWWFWGPECHQGFRVVLTDDAVLGPAPEVELTIEGSPARQVGKGHWGVRMIRVRGEALNRGRRAIEELELAVYPLKADGSPHWIDLEGSPFHGGWRPTFSLAWPALRNSAHEGPRRRPLRPGERRAFEVDVPAPYDAFAEDAALRFGARATAAIYGPE